MYKNALETLNVMGVKLINYALIMAPWDGDTWHYISLSFVFLSCKVIKVKIKSSFDTWLNVIRLIKIKMQSGDDMCEGAEAWKLLD